MSSLVQLGMYGAIIIDDTTTNLFYIIKFLSESYTLKNNTTIDGQVISAGKLVVKAQYPFSMQESTNLYWKQQPLKHNIMVPKCTILHPCLEVIVIRYVQYTPKKILAGTKQKKQYKDIQLL